jgi:YbbR domain-containing protein
MITFLENLVLKDFWLKLFSLGLAVLIWITVDVALKNSSSPLPSVNQKKRVFASLPVVVISSADDVRSVRVSPKEVEVTVEGDGKALEKLQAKDIRVMVDLTGTRAAHDLLQRIEVSAPAGVTHVRASPEEVQVVFPPRN